MSSFPDFFGFLQGLFGGFDFNFGSLVATILSLLGSIGGGFGGGTV